MNQEVTTYNNQFFGSLRVIMRDGNPWFVGHDVASALGFSNSRKALSDHCKKANTVTMRDGNRGNPNRVIIPESDLYRLVMRSQLPSAERFQDWVTKDILNKKAELVIEKAEESNGPAGSQVIPRTCHWHSVMRLVELRSTSCPAISRPTSTNWWLTRPLSGLRNWLRKMSGPPKLRRKKTKVHQTQS
ncbi:MAG: hypothetical protein CMI01_00345 [Oceanospirillaceae bacterium]|nr:hypothetical protein [Oceanospirillaceae bacterium]